MSRRTHFASLALGLCLAGATAAPARADLTREPYLQLVTPTSVTVVWRNDSSTDGRVRYGTDPALLDQEVVDPDVSRDHAIRVDGLSPDTRYYYDVGSTSTVHGGGTAAHYFVTAPLPGTRTPFTAWILGDSGTGNTAQRTVRDAMLAETVGDPPDIFLHMGDLAYDDGTDSQFTSRFFGVYADVLRNTVVWPTLGNHDADRASSATQSGPYYDAYVLPSAAEAGGVPSGTEAYYSFDYANVHFIVLDTADSDLSPTSAMFEWLFDDLAATTQEWVIAFFHHPPYSKGTHDSDDAGDSGGRLIDVRENALPILEAGGVDVVMSGHSHVYERSFLIDQVYCPACGPAPELATPAYEVLLNDGHIVDAGDGDPQGDGSYTKGAGLTGNGGTVYVVAGHGGKTPSVRGAHPVMAFAEEVHGSCLMTVDGPSLVLRNLRLDGVVSDAFSIVKASGQPCLSDAECDDGNPCTDDVCAATGTCLSTPNAAPCDDGDPCTLSDLCSDGECNAGTTSDCEDGNPCTDGVCDSVAGCVQTPNTASCDDGDPCTGEGTCAAGVCAAGAPLDCDNGDPCTVGHCEAGIGCVQEPVCTFADIQIDASTVRSTCDAMAQNDIMIADLTIHAHDDSVLIVMVAARESNSDCDMSNPAMRVTYGDVELEPIGSAASSESGWRTCTGIFYMLAPPVGTADVMVHFPDEASSPINNRYVGAVQIYNAEQQAPEAIAMAGADPAPGAFQTTIDTLTAGAMVIDVVVEGSSGTFTAGDGGQAELWQESCGNSAAAASTREAGAAGATVMAWTHDDPTRYAHVATAWAPSRLIPPTTTTTSTTSTSTTTTSTTTTSTSTTTTSTTTTTLPPPCREASECDDGDACTYDACEEAGCVSIYACAPAVIEIDEASVASACEAAPGESIVLADVTVADRDNSVLVATVGGREDNDDCDLGSAEAAVAYGGIPMTLAASAVSGTQSWRTCTGIFYLLDPPAGTADLTVDFPTVAPTTINNRYVGAMQLYGVAQQPPERVSASGADPAPVLIETLIADLGEGSLAIDVVGEGSDGVLTPGNVDQEQIWQVGCGSSTAASSSLVTSATGDATLAWLHSDPRRYAHSIAAWAPAIVFTPPTTSTTTTTVSTTTSTTTTMEPECRSDGECDDGEPCTDDLCAGGICVNPTVCVVEQIEVDTDNIASTCSASASNAIVLPDVTVEAHDNAVLIVSVGGREDNGDCDLGDPGASVTYGGQALQLAADAVSETSGWRTCSGVFFLLDPPAGTANVVVNFPDDALSTINNRHVGAMTIFNAAQQPPEQAMGSGSPPGQASASTTVATTSDGALLVDVITEGDISELATTEPGQMTRWDGACGSSGSGSSTRETSQAGEVDMGWTLPLAGRYAHTVTAWAPAVTWLP